jgi:hypothetical protein
MARFPAWILFIYVSGAIAALGWAGTDSLFVIDEQINAHLECSRLCREKRIEDADCGCASLTSVAERRLRELEKGGKLAIDCSQKSGEPLRKNAEKAAQSEIAVLWEKASSLRPRTSESAGIPPGNVEKFRREVDAIAARHPLVGDRLLARRHLIARERELKQAAKRFKVFPSQKLYGELLSALFAMRRENFWLLELNVACGKTPLAAILPGADLDKVPHRQIASLAEDGAAETAEIDGADEPKGEHSLSHIDEFGSE